MPPSTATFDPTSDPGVQSRAESNGGVQISTVLALLLLGLNLTIDVENISFGLWPAYLLPLFAAWWARRDGIAVALPLALLSLVPDIGFRAAFLSVGFGYSEVACVLAVGAAIACAPGDAAGRFEPVARPSLRRVWLAAMLVWVFAAMEGARQYAQGEVVSVAIDPLAVLAVLLAMLSIDARRLAGALDRQWRAGFMLLGAVLLVGLAMQVALRMGGLSLRLGSASASSLVPAAVFVAVMCGWTNWWRAVLLLGMAALLEQLALSTVGPVSDWALGVRGRPMPWILLAQGAVAAMLGTAFARERGVGSAAVGGMLRLVVSLPLALAGVLAILPALTLGQVQVWGTGTWVLAGVAFLGGRHLGVHGAIGVPLALLAAIVAVAVAIDPRLNQYALSSGLPMLAGIALAYGLAGWLAQRRDRAKVLAIPGAAVADAIDISVMARVVQQVDHAATLRAFFALLVPVLVIWQVAGIGIGVDFGLGLFDDEDKSTWIGMGVAAAFFALWPLAFVVVDWMDRQDRFRVLSAVTGCVLAWFGAAVLALGVGAPLPLVLEDAPTWVRAGAAALFATGAVTLTIGLLCRGPVWRRIAQVLVGLFGLAFAALLAALAIAQAEPDDPSIWLQLVAVLVALSLLVGWWVRAVRLRLILAEDRPRALLYGALPQGRFWVRMGALLGLPSSMWSRSAFRRPAAWCFLLARPLVYAGAQVLRSSAPLALLVVVAGHGLFAWGKRQAAALPWHPRADASDPRAPVLFLRGFEDDQFDFRRPAWQLRLRWFDLWSFRRNVDEAMVDEVAAYGPVVALGRPGEAQAPFGAQRHYASHEDWQDVVISTARGARAVVLVAGESPGLRWEFELLRREGLLDRTLLLLHPDASRAASNRRALTWLLGDESLADRLLATSAGVPVALLHSAGGPHLLCVDRPSAAAYVVALRAHFQRVPARDLASLLVAD